MHSLHLFAGATDRTIRSPLPHLPNSRTPVDITGWAHRSCTDRVSMRMYHGTVSLRALRRLEHAIIQFRS
ncbi:hypothetical protein [Roseiflexus castenholzii]|uniref:hypothetical protein n=1 Tax=Roseiflexus castenholzii TaxID=120962 RepID=UPI0023578FD6